MKELFAKKLWSLVIPALLLAGCDSGKTYPYESSRGIDAIIYQLQTQFGQGGRYTSIHMRYDDSLALILTITGVVEKKNDSLVVRQLHTGVWTQVSAAALVSLNEPPIFFSLDPGAFLKRVPGLISSSIGKMSQEINSDGLEVKEVLVNAPAYDPDGDPVRINIYVQAPDGREKFEYSYNTNGLLKGVLQY